jgi:radical SAM superfamily enzyme YgiQ (UPF0313 family)
VIERGAQFDQLAARSDAVRFNTVYSPIGILPPDQYLALVLQATDGCSFNTCTFCDLYHQAFRIKSPGEFRAHIHGVREYLGESMLLRRRSIFLGAANALAIPMARLRPMFDIIQTECHSDPAERRGSGRSEESLASPSEILRRTATHALSDAKHRGRARRNDTPGVYAFLDAFTGTRKSTDDYGALAQLGLKRVYIGLESGHDPLLEFVRKPGGARDAIDTVQAIKAGGVNVGVIVMIGLGGDRYTDGHIADTVDVLNAMPLSAGDLLYFSDLVEAAGTPYPMLAAQHSIRALTATERAAQRAAIRSGLRSTDVKIANYDVREFVY